MLICEAAGFDVILVETVGIGQSETAVADMTDFFLVLMLPGAGDELQGIKKGVVEIADMIAVNKADGDNIKRARAAAGEYRAALHILTPRSPTWAPPVVTYSAMTGDGIDALWSQALAHRQQLSAVGEFAARRREQQVKWMWAMLEDRFRLRLKTDAKLKARLPAIEKAVADGTLSPALAVEEIAGALGVGAMTTVLITGFGRFPGAPYNPSAPLARAVAKRRRPAFADVRRVLHIFETSYAAVDRDLPKLLAAHKPDIVLMFGLAGRTNFVRIETRARNARSVLFPDVTGFQPTEREIAAGQTTEARNRAVYPPARRVTREPRHPAACRVMPGAICAIMSTGARWRRPDPAR